MPEGWEFADGRPYCIEEDRGHDTPCWIFQGCIRGDSGTNGAGYGLLSRGAYFGVAHRWAYEQLVGPIPVAAVLDHLCKVRECINPAHLQPVTQAENVRRGALAKLTEEQAAEVHRLAHEGTLTQRVIGDMFGIGQQAVSMIKTGKRWAAPGGVIYA